MDPSGRPRYAGEQIKIGYIAKEELRQLLHLAHTQPTPEAITKQLAVFRSWCTEGDVPETQRLARTVTAWWPQIEAFLHTGITNAGSEGTNRVIKLEGRNAYGFRNATQRVDATVASPGTLTIKSLMRAMASSRHRHRGGTSKINPRISIRNT